MSGIAQEGDVSEEPSDAAPWVPSRPGASGTGSTDPGPTDTQLRTSIRVLLHIARQGRVGPEETALASLTQDGMARALGLSQGAISNALGRLVDGGVLEVELCHVRKRMIRVKVYGLTTRGEELVRRLRTRFGP
jgi:DNA-binding transcriptional ArsR family regulator